MISKLKGKHTAKPCISCIVLAMKLTVVLLVAAVLQVSAKGYGQQVSINEKDITVTRLLQIIEKQTSYHFLYDNLQLRDMMVKRISVSNASVEEVLNQSFRELPLSYKIVKKTIVVKRNKETVIPVQFPAELSLGSSGRVVSGKVMSSGGEPLQNVSVLILGTPIGTTTNNEGRFTLTAPDDKNVVLEISSVGYQTKRVNVGNQTEVNVVLELEVAGLSDVVVVGYGTQKKRELIGSVAQIDNKALEGRTAPKLSNVLAGLLSGVSVSQSTGRPGRDLGTINIRGVGSFGADAAPLVLVDGVQVASFDNINPIDIASISVLKDASSAAIYGARGANGVILITTQSGKEGRIKVTYNGYYGIQKPTSIPEKVNSWEYAALYNEASGKEVYSASDISKFRDGTDPDNYSNENMLKDILKKSAAKASHNISFSGGGSNSQYLFSLGYSRQEGIVPKNWNDLYNVRLNLIQNITPNLKISTRIFGTNNLINEPYSSASGGYNDVATLIGGAFRFPSVLPAKLSNGDWGTGIANDGNPVAWLDSKSFFKNNDFDLNGNLNLEWTPVKSLVFTLMSSYENYNSQSTTFRATQRINQNITNGPSQLTEAVDKYSYKTIQGLADYDKTFGEQKLHLLFGYSFETKVNKNFSAFRDNLPDNNLPVLVLGAPSNQQSTGSGYEWAIQSYFGRLNYSFKDRYLLNTAFRYDGSSRFPPGKKFGFFPSVAVGWRVSEEKFLKDKITWLTDLKFRASIGKLGNQNIANYPYQSVLVPGGSYTFGNDVYSGVYQAEYVDPTIHWETTQVSDAGIDVTLLGGKIFFSATYYDRHTYDILFKPSTSASVILGMGIGPQNMGKLQNKGWEFTLEYKNKIGKLRYNVDANFSTVENRVITLGLGNVLQPNGLIGNGSDLFIGYPMMAYYGYVADGLFTDQNDIDNYPNQKKINPTPQPGDIRYKDISGPDGKPDGIISSEYDRVVLGSQIPKYNFGLTIGFNYGKASLRILLQGVGGGKGFLGNQTGWAFFNQGDIQRWMADGRWTPENPNPDAIYPRLQIIPNGGIPNTQMSSFWILNANYLKVRNIQIGYDLSLSKSYNTALKRAHVFISAENILRWDKYRKGFDPELNNLTQFFYPILANYSIGVNVTF